VKPRSRKIVIVEVLIGRKGDKRWTGLVKVWVRKGELSNLIFLLSKWGKGRNNHRGIEAFCGQGKRNRKP